MMKKILFLMVLGIAGCTEHASLETQFCHPNPRTNTTAYVIGYGSLISERSRNKSSNDAGPNIPVRVHGYKRAWGVQENDKSYTPNYLGVFPEKGASFNGVVYKTLSRAALSRYDLREKGYCRVEVPESSLTFLVKNPMQEPKRQYWMYIAKPEFRGDASALHPIRLSYIDIFLGGCQEMEAKYHLPSFTQECMTTTYGWSRHLRDDRHQGLTAWLTAQEIAKVNQLLRTLWPDFRY